MRPRSLRLTTLLAATASALLALAAPALAHATVSAENTAAGGYTKLTFRVPHGCDGAPTTTFRVRIPDGVVSVKPQVNANWPELETIVGPLVEPYESHGETVTEGVREIVWSGGELPDAFMDEFGVSVKLPEGEVGDVLYFPAVQECPGGAQEAWIEIPDSPGSGEELEYPAPSITLTAAEANGHGEQPPTETGGAAETETESETETETETESAAAAVGSDDTTPTSATTSSSGVDPVVAGAIAVGVAGVAAGVLAVRSGRRGSSPVS